MYIWDNLWEWSSYVRMIIIWNSFNHKIPIRFIEQKTKYLEELYVGHGNYGGNNHDDGGDHGDDRFDIF